MMEQLQNKIAELFENGTINLMIGYKKDLTGQPVPCFIDKADQAKEIIFNADCKANLSVYLHKPEVKQAKKIGIIGNIAVLRSLIQLFSENQLWSSEITALTLNADGELLVFSDKQELESYVESNFPDFNEEDLKILEQLNAMTREERWKYWTDQFSACIKCYACRAVCPMCYCSQCTVECNQPQWIKTSAQTTGNLEWHMIRAMHLAGRCVNCGECGRICPAGIPVHLLTVKMNQDIIKEFGSKSGFSLNNNYVLNSFKPEDKENFIK